MIKEIELNFNNTPTTGFQETNYLIKFPQGYFVQQNKEKIVVTDFLPSARKWSNAKKALKAITQVLNSIPNGDYCVYDVIPYKKIEIYVESK